MFDDQRIQAETHGFQQNRPTNGGFFTYVNMTFAVEHWFIQSERSTLDHGEFNGVPIIVCPQDITGW